MQAGNGIALQLHLLEKASLQWQPLIDRKRLLPNFSPAKHVVSVIETACLQRQSLSRPKALFSQLAPCPAEGLPPKKMVGKTFSRYARPTWQKGNWAGFLIGRQGICQLKTAFLNRGLHDSLGKRTTGSGELANNSQRWRGLRSNLV